MKRIAAILCALACCQAAYAQNYHYNYGGARVVNQHQTGLSTPSGSYIGPGTLSQSAQGKQAGMGHSNGLPQVPLGSHVRTAGDNMYNNQGTEREANGALVYSDQMARKRAIEAARIRQMQLMQIQRQRKVQQGHFYVPGSNGAAASYAASGEQPQLNYNGNGAAVYTVPTTQNQAPKARQF